MVDYDLDKPDLTLKKMLESLKLVNGSWPSQKQQITENSFNCNSSGTKLNMEVIKEIQKLGFADVEIFAGNGTFSYNFIWKTEKKK